MVFVPFIVLLNTISLVANTAHALCVYSFFPGKSSLNIVVEDSSPQLLLVA